MVGVLLPGAGWFSGFKRQSNFNELANYASIPLKLISSSFKAQHPGKPVQQYRFSNVPSEKLVFLKLQRDSEIPEGLSTFQLIPWDKSIYYYYLFNNCSVPALAFTYIISLSPLTHHRNGLYHPHWRYGH